MQNKISGKIIIEIFKDMGPNLTHLYISSLFGNKKHIKSKKDEKKDNQIIEEDFILRHFGAIKITKGILI